MSCFVSKKMCLLSIETFALMSFLSAKECVYCQLRLFCINCEFASAIGSSIDWNIWKKSYQNVTERLWSVWISYWNIGMYHISINNTEMFLSKDSGDTGKRICNNSEMYWLCFCMVFINVWHSKDDIYYFELYIGNAWLNHVESCGCFNMFSMSAAAPGMMGMWLMAVLPWQNVEYQRYHVYSSPHPNCVGRFLVSWPCVCSPFSLAQRKSCNFLQ